jgi:hypothetical protein
VRLGRHAARSTPQIPRIGAERIQKHFIFLYPYFVIFVLFVLPSANRRRAARRAS